MKRSLCLLVLALFTSAFAIGCHAEADVGDDSGTGTDSHYKKTTTVNPNTGERTTHVEEHTNP